MQIDNPNAFLTRLGTGLSDGCLVLVTAASVFLSYHVLLQAAAGY